MSTDEESPHISSPAVRPVRALSTKQVGLLLLALGLLTFLLYQRKPDAFVNPQFWAEDAKIFFKDAHQLGHRSLFKEYSGYLHLFPRLVAYLATKLPYELAPWIFNYSAGIVALLVAVLLHSPRLQLRAPLVFTLALVAVPHIGGEVFMNLTNVQWNLALILLVTVTFTPPRTLGSHIIDALFVIVAGLSGPFIVPATVLLLWRWLQSRDPRQLPLLAIGVLISAVQLVTFLENRITMPPSPRYDAAAWPIVLGSRMTGTLFAGMRKPFEIDPRWWCLAGVLILGFVVWRLFASRQHKVGLPWLVFGLAVVAMALYKFRLAVDLLIHPAAAPRYFYVLSVTLTWCLLLILLSDRNRVAQAISLTLLLAIVYSAATSRFESPRWQDFHWNEYAPVVKRSEHVVVPINPPGWTVVFDGPS